MSGMKRLEDLRELHEAATPGRVELDETAIRATAKYGFRAICWCAPDGQSLNPLDERNAAYLVALYNAAPDLLAIVEAAEEVNIASQGLFRRLDAALAAFERGPGGGA